MTEAKSIGAILAKPKETLTAGPVSCERSRIDHLMGLPMEALTAADCQALRDWASCQSGDPQRASPQAIARSLEFLAASLPSKNIDSEAGQKRFAVYYRILGEHSEPAISYMTERVCRELDWFPTPHQCLAILSDFRPLTTMAERVERKALDSLQFRFARWIEALTDGAIPQEQIDDKPDQWKRVATERGLLRRVSGEPAYVQRFKALPDAD